MAKRAQLILDVCVIIVYSIFLLVILRTPNLKPPRLLNFPHSDKVVHAFQFAVLSFLLCRFFLRHSAAMGRFWIFIAAVAITASYGGVTELVQRTVPGRVADIADAGADTAGAVIAASILLLATTGRKSEGTAPEKVSVGQKEQMR